MRDFAKGSISIHLIAVALPTAAGMLAQIALHLVDLYFITGLGVAATAGVSAASNIVLIIVALTQAVGVGTVALVSRAIGRGDRDDALAVLNQCLAFGIAAAILVVAVIRIFARPYLGAIAADSEVIDAGTIFIIWAMPGYALAFPIAVLSSALRGAGVVVPLLLVSFATVVINIILAPILIAGWGTGQAFGVKGAAVATSISIAISLCLILIYCRYKQPWIVISLRLMMPRGSYWRRITTIGLPVFCDFFLVFSYTALVFYFIKGFGASVQAGFSVGSQLLNFVALPGLSVAQAVSPIVGQNFGAQQGGRIKATFRIAVLAGIALMAVGIALLQLVYESLPAAFIGDPSSLASAAIFLRLTSWSLIPLVVAHTCTTTLQGLGETTPALLSSAARLASFTAPLSLLVLISNLKIEYVWYLSVVSVTVQASLISWLLYRAFERRLQPKSKAMVSKTIAVETS